MYFCSFVWGATQIQIHLSCPLTSRYIRPLCIAVVMVQGLPGSTQDCLSLQAKARLLLNVPHICVHLLHPWTLSWCTMRSQKKTATGKRTKARLCHSFTAWTNIYRIEYQQAWATLKDWEQFTHLFYHKSRSIHSESVPDILCSVGLIQWLLCCGEHQATVSRHISLSTKY